MTLEEKVSQMKDVAPAIPRLGIPEYDRLIELIGRQGVWSWIHDRTAVVVPAYDVFAH
jgi:hypothetical protein